MSNAQWGVPSHFENRTLTVGALLTASAYRLSEARSLLAEMRAIRLVGAHRSLALGQREWLISTEDTAFGGAASLDGSYRVTYSDVQVPPDRSSAARSPVPRAACAWSMWATIMSS